MSALPGWWRPTHALDIGGVTWASDGRIAMVGDVPANARRPDPESVRGLVARSERGEIVDTSERVNGYVITTAGVFADYYVSIVEIGGPVEWRAAERSIVAWRAGVPVGIVMMMTTEPADARSNVHDGPPCQVCRGVGIDEHPCSTCGEPHEHECTACGGSGKWRNPESLS